MSVEQKLGALKGAVEHRTSISLEQFTHTVQHQHKKKKRWARVCYGVKKSSWDEQIIDFSGYNNAVASANQRILSLQKAIKSVLSSEVTHSQTQVANLKAKYGDLETALRNKTQQETTYQNQLYAHNREYQHAYWEISRTQSQIQLGQCQEEKLRAQRRLEQQLTQQERAKVHQQFEAQFEALNRQQRGLLYVDKFHSWGGNELFRVELQKLLQLGVDPSVVALQGCSRKDTTIFSSGCSLGADLQFIDGLFPGGRSLLQHVAHIPNNRHEEEEDTEFLELALESCENALTGLVPALSQRDIHTVEVVLQARPDLLQQMAKGYSLLQIASATQNIEMVQCLLSKAAELGQEATVGLLSSYRETAFEMAVNHKNIDLVLAFTTHLLFQQQQQQQEHEDNTDLLDLEVRRLKEKQADSALLWLKQQGIISECEQVEANEMNMSLGEIEQSVAVVDSIMQLL